MGTELFLLLLPESGTDYQWNLRQLRFTGHCSSANRTTI